MPRPKLLVLDLDGTLIRRDQTIATEDIRAVARARDAGIQVSIATGRLFSGSVEAAHKVGISGPIACIDGAFIGHVETGEHLVNRTVAGAHAKTLHRILTKSRPTTFVFAHDGIAHDSEGDPFLTYIRTWSPNVTAHDDVMDHPHWDHPVGVSAVVSMGTNDQILAAVDEVQETLRDSATVFSFELKQGPHKRAMIVRASGTNKGVALEFLAKHHGVTLEETVAIGDWLNDVPMLKLAGRSYVMAQAPHEVRSIAQFRLSRNGLEGGGVAEAVGHLLENLDS